jgi:hypothetical protein
MSCAGATGGDERKAQADGLFEILVGFKRSGSLRESDHLFNAAYDLEQMEDAEFTKIERMERGVDVLFVLLTSVYYDYEQLAHRLCRGELRRNGFAERMEACSEEDLSRAARHWAAGTFRRAVARA